MSKKTNTMIFILAATVTNIAMTLISFFILFLLYTMLIVPRLPADSTIWGLAIIFLAALVISFIVYQKLLKLFMKKVDVQKYFDPILKGPTSRG